jgi:LuxR family maltose regulon positive regulatory protein
MALWRLRAFDPAVDVMRGVLQEGSREGFFRIVVDEGTAIAGAVRAALSALKEAQQPPDPILMDYAQRLVAALGPDDGGTDAATAGNAEVAWHVEPLTGKEMRVLKLLAEGYSNSAIAEKLFVSDSTVRTHLRNINMKLSASNRTQAVSLARKYGLIR